MNRLRSAATPGFALFSLLLFAPTAPAQNTSSAVKPPVRNPKTTQTPKVKKSSARISTAKNVKSGELVMLDIPEGTIQIKDRQGKTTAYGLTEKTRFLRARHDAEATAFKPGDSIVIHLHKVRGSTELVAVEVVDRDSWAWIERIRHTVTEAVITILEEDNLTVAVGADRIPLRIAFSEKTLWSKDGKEANPSDFKAGDHIYIVPRSLPGGAIMARAITDTPRAAAQRKERLSLAVHGVVKSVEASVYRLTLTTPTGDTRLLLGNSETAVVQKSRSVGWSVLKAGQHIAARLHRDEADEPVCWKITIETGKAVKSSRPATGKPPG